MAEYFIAFVIFLAYTAGVALGGYLQGVSDEMKGQTIFDSSKK